MNFLKNLLFFAKRPDNLTFRSYFTDEQGVKTLSQIKQDYLEVHKAFSDDKVEDNHIIQDASYYDIFKIFNEQELVASVYLKKTMYYTKTTTFFGNKIKEEEAVEIYSLYVNDKYRGKGIARELIYYALKSIKEHYNLPNSLIIGLHLNEADQFMNVSFSLYYSMNFRKSSFVSLGPSSYAPVFQESYNFENPIKLVNEPSLCKDKGCFFAMYARYSELLPFNQIRNKDLFRLGEKLRAILKHRKSLEK